MKITFALTALSFLGVAIALPTPTEKREKADDGGYSVGEKRDAQPEEASNIFYAVGPKERDAHPEEATNLFYAVGPEKREEASNIFYAVGPEKRDAQPEEATNLFYAVGPEKRNAQPEQAVNVI